MSNVDHIALRVDDLKASEEWYLENVGGEVVFRDQFYIRLKVDNTFIALIDKKHYPHQHFGILVHKKEDLPVPEDKKMIVHHRDGTIGVYLKDPSGNYVEFIWYSDECKEKLST